MRVRLTPSWELTDERDDSFPGQPFLVDRRSGEAFGAGDIMEPYAYWEPKPAAVHADRMSYMEERTREEIAFIKRFSQMRPG